MAKSFGFRNREQKEAQALWVELKRLEQCSPVDKGAVSTQQALLDAYKEGNSGALGLKSKKERAEIYEAPKVKKPVSEEPVPVVEPVAVEPEPEPVEPAPEPVAVVEEVVTEPVPEEVLPE